MNPEAEKIVKEFIKNIEPDAVISEIRNRPDGTWINIKINDEARMIGKAGRTLEAINHIIRLVLKKTLKFEERVTVDIARYLERRIERLKMEARQKADNARRNGHPEEIENLNASERRVIHLALESEKDIKTESTGEGINRKILIIPQTRIE